MSNSISASQRPAKTRKGKRALEKRAPKEADSGLQIEDPKKLLLLQGNKVSQVVRDVLTDLHKLKKSDSMKYSRKNDLHPFEPGQEVTMQFFCERSDCASFCLANHSKKRPNNLVIGRMFNFQLLDMVELGVADFTPISSFDSASAVQAETKPGFIFLGERFAADSKYQLLKSVLVDLFRGSPDPEVSLTNIERVFVCCAHEDGKVSVRHYCVKLKKSGTKVPRVELLEAGPFLKLEVRRIQEAPPDLMREALQRPSTDKKKQKNVGFDDLDGKIGRIYMPKQDLTGLNLVKGKGLKRQRREAAQERQAKKRISKGDTKAE